MSGSKCTDVTTTALNKSTENQCQFNIINHLYLGPQKHCDPHLKCACKTPLLILSEFCDYLAMQGCPLVVAHVCHYSYTLVYNVMCKQNVSWSQLNSVLSAAGLSIALWLTSGCLWMCTSEEKSMQLCTCTMPVSSVTSAGIKAWCHTST